jgi:hypothetical protein
MRGEVNRGTPGNQEIIMSRPVSIEERVAALEAEVAELKRRLAELTPQPKNNWLDVVLGLSLKDYPEFEEVVRYGREFRESDRPRDGE